MVTSRWETGSPPHSLRSRVVVWLTPSCRATTRVRSSTNRAWLVGRWRASIAPRGNSTTQSATTASAAIHTRWALGHARRAPRAAGVAFGGRHRAATPPYSAASTNIDRSIPSAGSSTKPAPSAPVIAPSVLTSVSRPAVSPAPGSSWRSAAPCRVNSTPETSDVAAIRRSASTSVASGCEIENAAPRYQGENHA